MTKTLISAVGTTDPIRNFFDGPLLHIARRYKPERIVLIFSEEMLSKEIRIRKALNAIDGYTPEIIIEEEIIKDDDVFIFDRMFNQMSNIVAKYNNSEDELILNLSSGTPQMIAAMFAINRINDYNVKAVQVASPEKKSNEGIGYDNQEDIDALIETNEDNSPSFTDRTIEDQAEKFNQALLKRNLRELIRKYDYKACYNTLTLPSSRDLMSRSKKAKLNNQLEDFVEVFQKQTLLKDLQKTALSENQKKALNNFMAIDVLHKRGAVSDVLIKAKSLAEFILKHYINENYPDLIFCEDKRPILNPEHPHTKSIIAHIEKSLENGRGYPERSTLNLLSLRDIISYYDPSNPLTTDIKAIVAINNQRNRLAHDLSEIDIKNKQITETVIALKNLVREVLKIDDNYFNYYDNKNEELLALLQ